MQEQKSKSTQRREDVQRAARETAGDAQELKDDLDALLDEVDSVLEENAAEFVAGYVQKGGE